MAKASKKSVATMPAPIKIAMSALRGSKIQPLFRAHMAVTQNAAKAIPESPRVACVQAFTPSQCGWSAIPRKSGTCQISHTRLSRNEKTTTLNSGVLGRLASQRTGLRMFDLLSIVNAAGVFRGIDGRDAHRVVAEFEREVLGDVVIVACESTAALAIPRRCPLPASRRPIAILRPQCAAYRFLKTVMR